MLKSNSTSHWGGCQRLLHTSQITSRFLILSLSGSLCHSNDHTHSLAHQSSAVSKVPWQSITAVETAQVLFMRKTLAKTSMRLWTLHTQSTTTQHHPRLIRSLRPRLATRSHCHIAGFWRSNNESNKLPDSPIFCKSGSRIFAFSCQQVCCWTEEEEEIRMLGSEFIE